MGDFPQHFQILSDAEVAGPLHVFRSPVTLSQVQIWCQAGAALNEAGLGYICSVIRKFHGDLIGHIGMAQTGMDNPKSWEIGYWLRKDCWGQGFAQEMLRAMLHSAQYDFKLESMTARSAVDNDRSNNLLKRTDFIVQKEIFKDEVSHDDHFTFKKIF